MRNHANINLNVWSNNDFSTCPVVNPVFLVLLVSVTFITLEIFVVSKSPGIMRMDHSRRVSVGRMLVSEDVIKAPAFQLLAYLQENSLP